MNGLLVPIRGLLSRMRLSHKIGLVGILFLIPIVILGAAYINAGVAVIHSTRLEQVGLTYVPGLKGLMQSVAQSRLLTARFHTGDTALAGQIDAVGTDVDKHLTNWQTLTSQNKDATGVLPSLKKLDAQWQQLKSSRKTLSPKEAFDRHTELMVAVQDTFAKVLDGSGLVLDPELLSYYLMDMGLVRVTTMIFETAQARGLTVSLINNAVNVQSNGVSKPSYGALAISLNHYQLSKHGIKEDAGKIAEAAPALKAPMAGALEEMTRSGDLFFEDINRRFLTDSPDLLSIDREQWVNQANQAIAAQYKLFDLLVSALDQALEQRIADQKKSLWSVGALSLVVFLLVVYWFVGVLSHTQHAVGHIVKTLDILSSGNLTEQPALTGSDEFGHISRAIYQQTASFRKTFQVLTQAAEHMNSNASSVAVASTQLGVAATLQADSAGSMAAAVEQLTTSIEQVSGSAGVANDLVQQTQDTARQGAQTVSRTEQSMREIAQAAQSLSKLVHEVGDGSQSISKVIEVIEHIANQTNLLALNAAIEAARAGEQGRGFAVVADEVRRLAERTAESTHEIRQMIAAMQNKTDSAIGFVDGWMAQIDDGANQANTAQVQIEALVDQACRVASSMHEINSALMEQNVAASSLAQYIEKLAQGSEENAASVNTVSGSAQDLEQLCGDVHTQVCGFKLA